MDELHESVLRRTGSEREGALDTPGRKAHSCRAEPPAENREQLCTQEFPPKDSVNII